MPGLQFPLTKVPRSLAFDLYPAYRVWVDSREAAGARVLAIDAIVGDVRQGHGAYPFRTQGGDGLFALTFAGRKFYTFE